MYKKRIVTSGIFLLLSFSLSGQCPDREKLWNRLFFLRDSSKAPPASEQLKELLAYKNQIEACPYKGDSTNAFLLQRIASTYSNLGEYFNALAFVRQSIDLINKNAGKASMNPGLLKNAYFTQSVNFGYLNKFPEKRRALDSCYDICIRLNQIDRYCLFAIYSRVEYFFDIGDYHRCINYSAKCEELALHRYDKSKDNGDLLYASSSLLWNTNSQMRLGDFQSAEKMLESSLEKYKKLGLKNNLGNLYAEMAQVQVAKGDFNKALSYYKEAFSLNQSTGQINATKTILNNIGFEIYFTHYADYKNSLYYYSKALKCIDKDPNHNKLEAIENLNVLTNIANVYVALENFDTALKYFQLAFDQLSPAISPFEIVNNRSNEIMSYPKLYYLTDLFIDYGTAYEKRYLKTHQVADLSNAIRIYKLTDRLLDLFKSAQSDLESKLFWRASSRRLFEKAINASYVLKNNDDLFYFFEKSRAILLEDQLKEQKWFGESDILSLAQVRKQIQQLEADKNLATLTADQVAAKETELFAKKRELDGLTETVRNKNPLYFQSYLDTATITVTDIRKKILSDFSALIELFTGDSSIYTIVITKNNFFSNRTPRVQFDSLSENYLRYLTDQEEMNKKFNEFVEVSHKLYELILPPGSLPKGRIIVSLDGKYFPFEPLVSRVNPITYLLNDHGVSYTYSARYLFSKSEDPSSSGNKFLGLAPVSYNPNMKLSNLDGSDQSLKKIGALFEPSKILVHIEASRNNFMHEFFDHNIVQFYTHSAATTPDRREPVIYFADSAVYLSELIPGNKPQTKLVVLSACETGSGKEFKGEGVFSFNRAFAAMGVPTSIVNLWPVDNQSTYRLTELFHKYLAQGASADIALQKAKLEFLQSDGQGQNQLPSSWAGPILIGDPDVRMSSSPNKRRNYAFVLAGILLVIVTTSFVYFKYSRKTQKPTKIT